MNAMLAAVDVQYDEGRRAAAAAAVVFETWSAAAAIAEHTVECNQIQAYIPGEFYKRELPCLLAILERIVEPLDAIVIDGYVSLGGQPGLGMRLWDALDRKTPIVGVAKTRFLGAEPTEVFRGQSRNPLYVTAVGIDVAQAAVQVAQMAGPYRVPTLLKRVDRLARDHLTERL